MLGRRGGRYTRRFDGASGRRLSGTYRARAVVNPPRPSRLRPRWQNADSVGGQPAVYLDGRQLSMGMDMDRKRVGGVEREALLAEPPRGQVPEHEAVRWAFACLDRRARCCGPGRGARGWGEGRPEVIASIWRMSARSMSWRVGRLAGG